MKLINAKTREPVKVGARVKTFRGEEARLIGSMEPHRASSTGRIVIKFDDGHQCEFFPSVCGLMWVEDE